MPATLAEWLRTERLRRKWTQAETVAELKRKTGYTLSRVWYSHYENGQMPSGPAIVALEELYGSRAPEPQDTTLAQVVVALHRQATAIERLVAKLDVAQAPPKPDPERIEREAEADVAAFLDEIAAGTVAEDPLPEPPQVEAHNAK